MVFEWNEGWNLEDFKWFKVPSNPDDEYAYHPETVYLTLGTDGVVYGFISDGPPSATEFGRPWEAEEYYIRAYYDAYYKELIKELADELE